MEPMRGLVELEPEERAALALHGERLVERLAIEAVLQLDHECGGFAGDACDAGREAGVAPALLADAYLIEPAGGDLLWRHVPTLALEVGFKSRPQRGASHRGGGAPLGVAPVGDPLLRADRPAARAGADRRSTAVFGRGTADAVDDRNGPAG